MVSSSGINFSQNIKFFQDLPKLRNACAFRYTEKLRRGLHKVLSTDNAWVVTGGTDVGIMRLCGLALEDQKISEKNESGEKTR